MDQLRKYTTRVLRREANVITVAFTEPDPPRFPGAPALREDHPSVLQPDDHLLRVAFWPRGRRVA